MPHQGPGMRLQTRATVIIFGFIGPSYAEFYWGSFELFTGTFRRLDPELFEFKQPTAVNLLNGTSKKKFSNLAENGTNRPDDIKSGANLSSDRKFEFVKKSEIWAGVLHLRCFA